MRQSVTLLTSEESFINNYGAALQGKALCDTIAELGYDVIVVRYHGGDFIENDKLYYLYWCKHTLGKFYHRLFPTQITIKKKKLQKEFETEISLREKFFVEFQRENFHYFNMRRMNWHMLKKNYPKTNIYMCGSDQIWNPYMRSNRNDPGYFLAFAPEGTKKIAYAPSFGSSDLPNTAKANLEELLKDYTAISVREKSGVDIVKKYANRDAKWVVDPTLLRTPEQWKRIARKPKNLPEKYILCYRFAESDATRKAVDETAERMGLPVVSMPLSDVALQDPYQFVFDAGPREFIGLIQNAELVCTDSFHATVFSVLMKTPVCVFLRESYNSGNSMNSRVYSLLEMLHLEQLIKTDNENNSKVLECLDVDYTEAHERLKVLREDSMAFLENALNN